MACRVASMLGEETRPLTGGSSTHRAARSHRCGRPGARGRFSSNTWSSRSSLRPLPQLFAPRFSISPSRRSSSGLRGHGPLQLYVRWAAFANVGSVLRPRRGASCLRLPRPSLVGTSTLSAPALAAQRSFVLYQAERQLPDDLAEVNRHLERANLSFATATGSHARRAGKVYRRSLGCGSHLRSRHRETEWALPEQQQLAHLCGSGSRHRQDRASAGLLEKPGALTLEERRQMEEHSLSASGSWPRSTTTRRSPRSSGTITKESMARATRMALSATRFH